MKELAYQAMRTDMSVNRLSEEMREFKNEMHGFKDETRLDRQRMNKQWGELANRPDACVINRATRKGVLVMGMGDEAMRVLNPDVVQKGR